MLSRPLTDVNSLLVRCMACRVGHVLHVLYLHVHIHVLHVLHVDDIPSPSTAAPRESGPSEVELPESRPPSREDARRETRNELRGLQHDNDHLLEQLIAAERDLNEQLKSEVNRANRLREMCSFRHTYPPTTAPTKIILPNSTHYSRATEDLIQWLKSLDIDDRSVRAIMNEGYTKTDILELVSREELLNIGVRQPNIHEIRSQRSF